MMDLFLDLRIDTVCQIPALVVFFGEIRHKFYTLGRSRLILLELVAFSHVTTHDFQLTIFQFEGFWGKKPA